MPAQPNRAVRPEMTASSGGAWFIGASASRASILKACLAPTS